MSLDSTLAMLRKLREMFDSEHSAEKYVLAHEKVLWERFGISVCKDNQGRVFIMCRLWWW